MPLCSCMHLLTCMQALAFTCTYSVHACHTMDGKAMVMTTRGKRTHSVHTYTYLHQLALLVLFLCPGLLVALLHWTLAVASHLLSPHGIVLSLSHFSGLTVDQGACECVNRITHLVMRALLHRLLFVCLFSCCLCHTASLQLVLAFCISSHLYSPLLSLVLAVPTFWPS